MITVRELARMIKIDGVSRLDEPMAAHTSFRIGGPADLYVAPSTAREAEEVLGLCRTESVPCFVLGGGTNLLVADRGVRGVVIDISRISGISTRGESITAAGGAAISDVADCARAHGLSGLEFAYALPGTVGGAVWMNARCYDREIADVAQSITYLDADLRPARRNVSRDEWSYKRSPFQGMDGLILEATFRLSAGDPAEISRSMEDHKADRVSKGHFLFPCAGSVFKNNRDFGAPTGKLIDSLGLKGAAVGAARVAPFHGNIIVNTGGARAADVRALMERIEGEVSRRLGFTLEREVILVGDWDGPTPRG